MHDRRVRPAWVFRRFGTVTGAILGVVALATVAFANVPLTTVSQDPYTNTNTDVYHQTQVEPDTFAYGSTIVSVFQTGRFSTGGSDNTGWATSVNGGASWTNGFMPRTTVYATPPGPYARISDPSVAYDPKHDVWLALSLTVDAKNTALVNRSTDGGLTWKAPVIVSTPVVSADYDKTWIACDTWATSPHYGNCYATWDNYLSSDTVMMSTSTDGGKTWTLATVAPAHGLGGQPLAQPNGNVVVPFLADAGQIQSLVSTDGGKTFSGPYMISTQTDHLVVGVRTEPLPSAEVDAKGKVYVVWQDCRFRTGCSANDIVMSTSKSGTTWSATVRLPIDAVGSTVDHFIPGIAVDTSTSGATAHLGLTYYYYPTAACTFATCKMDAGFVSSTDGGATWSAPTKILGALKLAWLPSAGGRFVGDYISTSIVGGQAFAVIANATQTACAPGQLAACNEFMVAPTTGLPVIAGTRTARAPAVRATHSDHQRVLQPTAF
jgi:hypothetical protein